MAEISDLRREYSLSAAQRQEKLLSRIASVRAKLNGDALVALDKRLRPYICTLERPLGIEDAWQPDYFVRPVSIRKFVEDPYYLGLKGSIYPRIVDDLEQLFEGAFEEVVLAGAQRWGKSVFAEVGIAYEIYRASCLRDPGRTFGSLPGTKLAFVNASLTVQQARRVIFEGLLRLIKQSPYFREHFPPCDRIKSEIRFRRGMREDVICYAVAANEQAFMGADIFSAAIDEANFMQVIDKSKRATPGEGDRYDQVESIYNRLLVRLKGSWNHPTGMPGHMWLISSARYPGDFTERKELEARDNPRIFVRHYAVWETKPGLSDSPRFRVEVGDVTRRSRVLPDDEAEWPPDVNRERVIAVPVLFKEDFLRNPEKCVRDLAGISVLSLTPFISDRRAIRAMFEQGTAAGLKPTFTRLEVTLQNPLPELECLIPENLHWITRPKLDSMRRPMFRDSQAVTELLPFPALYYCHVDLSRTRCATGIVIAHAVQGVNVPRLDEQTMQTVYESKPMIRVDLALRVLAPPNGEIDIPRVRSLIYQLHSLGFEFGLISFDTFGSEESVKSLRDRGFTSEVYSLERELTPWEEMKQALYDRRLMCYEFPHLEKELAQLELVKGRIEKPSYAGASKDIADCLAAVVHHVEDGWRRAEGSRGMFQFGAVEYPGNTRKPITLIDSTTTNIAHGRVMTEQEVDEMLFGPLKDRDER